jgi:hypothetical protein
MRADDARRADIARLSDLKAHPDLRLGLSQEFIGRADGWPGLKRTYELPFDTPRGLDHGLAYEAIAQRQVDAIDIYSTDAKLDKYSLTVLADDRTYFPRYDAVLLYRADLPQRLPKDVGGAHEIARHDRRRGDAQDERRRRAGEQGLRHRSPRASSRSIPRRALPQRPRRRAGSTISGASSSVPISGA